MKYKYNQKLPVEVEEQLDAYIKRIKAIKWLKPSLPLNKEKVEQDVKIALEGFGVKAKVEYRSLKTVGDWDAARDAAWGAWDAAWDAARDAARNAAWGAARDAWGARDAARDAAWGATDLLAFNLKDYRVKYPNGNFILLIPLWEAGLYPCGVIDGKFIIYVPE